MINYSNSSSYSNCNESDRYNNFIIAPNSAICEIKDMKKQYQYYFQKYSTNVKKNWNLIKSIATLKAKAKTSPNSLT